MRAPPSTLLVRFVRNDRGATAVEYGLLLALLVLAMVGGMAATGKNIDVKFKSLSSTLDSAPPN